MEEVTSSSLAHSLIADYLRTNLPDTYAALQAEREERNEHDQQSTIYDTTAVLSRLGIVTDDKNGDVSVNNKGEAPIVSNGLLSLISHVTTSFTSHKSSHETKPTKKKKKKNKPVSDNSSSNRQSPDIDVDRDRDRNREQEKQQRVHPDENHRHGEADNENEGHQNITGGHISPSPVLPDHPNGPGNNPPTDLKEETRPRFTNSPNSPNDQTTHPSPLSQDTQNQPSPLKSNPPSQDQKPSLEQSSERVVENPHLPIQSSSVFAPKQTPIPPIPPADPPPKHTLASKRTGSAANRKLKSLKPLNHKNHHNNKSPISSADSPDNPVSPRAGPSSGSPALLNPADKETNHARDDQDEDQALQEPAHDAYEEEQDEDMINRQFDHPDNLYDDPVFSDPTGSGSSVPGSIGMNNPTIRAMKRPMTATALENYEKRAGLIILITLITL